MPSSAGCMRSGRRWPMPRRGEDPARGDDVRDAGALRAPGAPAALRGGDPGGRDRPRRDRLRGSQREGRGRGPGILRDGGVEVEFAAGAEASAARLLNQPFRKHARTGLPLVTLKMAMSLDGQTATGPATAPGSPASRAAPWSTAGAPNPTRSRSASAPPSPTTRCSPPATPTPASRSASSSTPRPASPSTPSSSRPSTSPRSSSSPPPRPTRPRRGPARRRRRDPRRRRRHPRRPHRAALADLGRRGVTSLFLEGGRTLASAFAAADQIDEARTFVAPVLLGEAAAALARVRGGGAENEHRARRLPCRRLDAPRPDPATERVGEDILITARFREW